MRGTKEVVGEPFFVGADGCKGGWFAIRLTKGREWDTKLFASISELWEEYQDASLILLDVPIGMKEAGPDERLCDKEARRKLGRERGCAVFPVPVRPAIYEGTYEEGKATNRKLSGKGLSVQTWSIVPKIKEVDTFFFKS
ncbi:MAG: DUF429 domain-containing protein [Desulfobaccales bacterium]